MFLHLKISKKKKSMQYHSKLIMAIKFYMICDIIETWKQGFWIQMVNLLARGPLWQNGEASKALFKPVLVKHKIKQNWKRNQTQQITVIKRIFLLTNCYSASSNGTWCFSTTAIKTDIVSLLKELMLFLVIPFLFNSSIIQIQWSVLGI